MKRALGIGILMATLAVLVVPTASADFHFTDQACADATGSARVILAVDGDEFVFTGEVTCPGADSVTITSLTLTPLVPPGEPVEGDTPQSCTTDPCSEPVTADGTAPAAPGIHQVRMEFTAEGPGGTTFDRVRTREWLWAGAGEPIRLS